MTDQEKYFIEYCIKGDLNVISNYIQKNVNIHVEDDWAFKIVTERGYADIIIYFLKNGISHEIASSKGVLKYAVHFKNVDLVKFLISSSDEYKKDFGALQWAIEIGNLELIELVLPFVDNLDWSYCTAAKRGNIHVIKYLNDNQIYNHDRNMNLVLNWAIKASKFDIAELLINEGIVDYNTLIDEGKIKYELWKKSNNQ